MIKAVLLDLDDTLLGNPPDTFTTSYLGALDAFLCEYLDWDGAPEALLRATYFLGQSRDPLRTNVDTFYDTLEPLLPVEIGRAVFDEALDAFYAAAYPRLEAITQRRPAARELVEWLVAREYIVVVATSPYFPREAVLQRMAWAGVPLDEVPFRLVTTLENMHYTKPHMQYYEEILARIGVQADEAVMVGDDWSNDIVPAWCAGLNTFWITNDGASSPAASDAQPDGAGSLAEFLALVREENWLDALTPRPLDPAQILPRLEGNLAALLGIVDEVAPEKWTMRPDSQEWSPVEVVCHLHESERDVQRPRLQTIVDEDNPFLSQPKAPPAPAARVCPCCGRALGQRFGEERLKTIAYLAGLPPEAWTRPARHYIFGPTTLLEMANFTAQHDRLHMAQLCQTVAHCE